MIIRLIGVLRHIISLLASTVTRYVKSNARQRGRRKKPQRIKAPKSTNKRIPAILIET
jgi:hypothetical protein